MKKRRLDLELSKAKVAKLLNLNVMSITHWEANLTNPVITSMPKIISFLGYIPLTNVDPESLRGKVLSYRMINGMSQTNLSKKIVMDCMQIPLLEKGKKIEDKYTHRIEKFLMSPS